MPTFGYKLLEGASWARSNQSTTIKTTIVSFMRMAESIQIPEPPELTKMNRLLMRMEIPNTPATHSIYPFTVGRVG